MKSEKTKLDAVKSCVLSNNYDSLQVIPKDFKTSVQQALCEFGYTLEDLKIRDPENILSNIIFSYCPSAFGLKDFKGGWACSGSCTACWNTKL